MDLSEEKSMLIANLISEGYLKTDKVVKAFRDVPREMFVNESDTTHAYSDYPLDIGCGQTISAPHMVAMITELLRLRPKDKVLEIGAGSGYQAAILSRLAGSVYAIELEPGLAALSKNNLTKAGIDSVHVIAGDGSKGLPQAAPFDRIVVSCATPEIFPAWKSQLADGGILIAPVGGFFRQELIVLKRSGGAFAEESHGDVMFVPLRTR